MPQTAVPRSRRRAPARPENRTSACRLERRPISPPLFQPPFLPPSFLPPRFVPRFVPLGGKLETARSSATLAARIAEVLEEIRLRPQHQTGIVGTQAGLVGLHRAVKGEEAGILAVGLGEDAVSLGVALAARLLG